MTQNKIKDIAIITIAAFSIVSIVITCHYFSGEQSGSSYQLVLKSRVSSILLAFC